MSVDGSKVGVVSAPVFLSPFPPFCHIAFTVSMLYICVWDSLYKVLSGNSSVFGRRKKTSVWCEIPNRYILAAVGADRTTECSWCLIYNRFQL